MALQVLRVKVAAADGKTRKALDEKAALEATLEATGERLVASKEAEKELVTAMEGLERQRAAEQTLTAKADRAWGRTRHFIEGAAQEAVRTPAVRPSSPAERPFDCSAEHLSCFSCDYILPRPHPHLRFALAAGATKVIVKRGTGAVQEV